MKTRRFFSMIAAFFVLCGYAAGQTKPIPDCSSFGAGCNSFNELVNAKDEQVLEALKADPKDPKVAGFSYVCFPQSPRIADPDYFQIVSLAQLSGPAQGLFAIFVYQDGQTVSGEVLQLKKDSIPGSWSPDKPWQAAHEKLWHESFDAKVDSDSIWASFKYRNTLKQLFEVNESIRRSTLRISEEIIIDSKPVELSGQCVSYPPQTKQADGKQEK